jgi:hypothetical protein
MINKYELCEKIIIQTIFHLILFNLFFPKKEKYDTELMNGTKRNVFMVRSR